MQFKSVVKLIMQMFFCSAEDIKMLPQKFAFECFVKVEEFQENLQLLAIKVLVLKCWLLGHNFMA